MPRLIVEDDDGRELFAGQISQENLAAVARFLRRHHATLRTVATVKRSIDSVIEAISALPAIPPPRSLPRRKRTR